MDEFIAHWTDTNAVLGGTPATDLVLEGNVTLAIFITSRNDLEAKLIADQALENARQIATANRDGLKLALKDRLGQFRGLIRGMLSKTKYAAAAPTIPELSLSESKFLSAFDDAADLWGRIDADATIAGFTPPLKILLYGRMEFVADLAAVRVTFVTVTTAENDLEINQEERDMMLPIARERMVQYRVLVPALLGPTHPQSQSLPDLYPAPGSTPDPVVLSASWNAATVHAVLNWTASTNPALAEYEIRMSPGATYNDATATVMGNVPAGTSPDPVAATSFATTAGLAASGDMATFKVFVRLTTGNEAGSNAVTITRP
jgi:hypothetical protein